MDIPIELVRATDSSSTETARRQVFSRLQRHKAGRKKENFRRRKQRGRWVIAVLCVSTLIVSISTIIATEVLSVADHSEHMDTKRENTIVDPALEHLTAISCEKTISPALLEARTSTIIWRTAEILKHNDSTTHASKQPLHEMYSEQGWVQINALLTRLYKDKRHLTELLIKDETFRVLSCSNRDRIVVDVTLLANGQICVADSDSRCEEFTDKQLHMNILMAGEPGRIVSMWRLN